MAQAASAQPFTYLTDYIYPVTLTAAMLPAASNTSPISSPEFAGIRESSHKPIQNSTPLIRLQVRQQFGSGHLGATSTPPSHFSNDGSSSISATVHLSDRRHLSSDLEAAMLPTASNASPISSPEFAGIRESSHKHIQNSTC